MASIERLKTISGKIFDGSATREEEELFWKYFDETGADHLREELFPLSAFSSSKSVRPQESEADQMLQVIRERIRSEHNDQPVTRKISWIKYASAAVMAGAIAIVSMVLLQDRKTTSSLHVTQKLQWDTIQNPGKNPLKVRLADGSQVWLNTGACLLVSADFEADRMVKLRGEAFFKVEGNAVKPFEVAAGNIRTLVLGTEFNIDGFDSGQRVQISLLSGKIKISHLMDSSLSYTLKPGQMLEASQSAFLGAPSSIHSDAVDAWRHGALVLNNMPMRDALKKIGAFYAINISCEDEVLLSEKVTAVYERGQNWKDVLHNLLFIYHYTFVTEKDTIYIKHN
ncbi:FecR family protein [Chitinophaga barathri]|uniref:DUF4974 domain-containing protein n=1 Tax=Chitinophaga barathri TaxID=1647451 RepID=A0A3N4MU18_9BACT|nr:FecR domain-containing protein [Chitinophaga barathri]RPD43049.1 DUF4974 domain-containing protein [Chitinophaga barathri]